MTKDNIGSVMEAVNKILKAQSIYKCLVGSRAYGTAIETSDYDYKGIYIQTTLDAAGFFYQPQIEIGKDETYYEIKRFLDLLGSANPTVLEMLFVNESEIYHPVMKILLDQKERFLTKKCLLSFGGYVVSQIKKAKGLNKKMNWEQNKIVRKTPLDFCYVPYRGGSIPLIEFLRHQGIRQECCGLQAINHMPNCYYLYCDWNMMYGKDSNTPDAYPEIGYRGVAFEESNDIRLSSIPKDKVAECIVHYNKDAYSIHCKEYLQYQEWLQNRNEQRYVDNENSGQRIDGKNLLHCVRLLDMCEEIVKERTIKVLRPNREYLLSIRRGEVKLDNLIDESEVRLQLLNDLYAQSDLPEDCPIGFCNEILTQMRIEYDKSRSS